jgi:outer membrane protein assembly factor BamE (lipoprotein component of BamABCDE complex)
MKGNKKCNEKNRFSVALATENPPHSQVTIIFPKYGIADTKFVITVAPQKDICPQGSTYPRKAVAIRANRISTPEIHTWVLL